MFSIMLKPCRISFLISISKISSCILMLLVFICQFFVLFFGVWVGLVVVFVAFLLVGKVVALEERHQNYHQDHQKTKKMFSSDPGGRAWKRNQTCNSPVCFLPRPLSQTFQSPYTTPPVTLCLKHHRETYENLEEVLIQHVSLRFFQG